MTTAPDGITRVIVYHAWDPDMRARRMFMDELYFEQGVPKSDGPTWMPSELPREMPPKNLVNLLWRRIRCLDISCSRVNAMQTERNKMLAGELYDPLDPELVAAREKMS